MNISSQDEFHQVDTNWWNSVVFYEIFVRSFYDSDGDGIGDIKGVTEKLDYLNDGDPATDNDLGITGIWLMPIQPSPSYHGYDVIDYYSINPDYGTKADFDELLTEAHKRGIYVIMDLVINHTSNENPWFTQANEDRNSPYRDWYLWKDTTALDLPGNYWRTGLYGEYYGYFDTSMPDLNYTNPAVTAEMEKIVTYWLEEVGVDGYRIDAIKHLIEEDGLVENTSSTHEWLKGFYTFYKSEVTESFTVGEVFGSDARVASIYSDNELDMIFNFELASGFMNSARGESNTGIISAIKFIQKDMPSWQFATFLTNHDQNRVMSVLNGKEEKAKVAASMLLTSPGTPFIYYGEEIGMQGVKPDEDIRKPMQWNDGSNAGFSTVTPWRDVDPGYTEVNVEAGMHNPESIIEHYRKLIHLRNKYPALLTGGLEILETGNKGVYAAIRVDIEEPVLILINLTSKETGDYQLADKNGILPKGNYELKTLMGEPANVILKVKNNGFEGFMPLDVIYPYQTNVYLLEK